MLKTNQRNNFKKGHAIVLSLFASLTLSYADFLYAEEINQTTLKQEKTHDISQTEVMQLNAEKQKLIQDKQALTEQLTDLQNELATNKKLTSQRAVYQQATALLATDDSISTQHLVQRLAETIKDYPLYEDLQYKIFLANKANWLQQDITQFQQQYPTVAQNNSVQTTWLKELFQRSDWQGILLADKRHPSSSVTAQCIVLSAQYYQFADQLPPLPATMQSAQENLVSATTPLATETQTKLDNWQRAVNKLWLTGNSLPNQCDDVLQKWAERGFQTNSMLQHRALLAFEKNNQNLVRHLRNQATDEEVKAWLDQLITLQNKPLSLSDFIQQAKVNSENRRVLESTFSHYLKSLPISKLDPQQPFAQFAQIAEKFNVSNKIQRVWQIQLIGKIFDEPESAWQNWRDKMVRQLKDDKLTARRIRVAMRMQQPLQPWLSLLSAQGKAKNEWQYWQAKVWQKSGHKTQANQQWEKLADKRGFYPMLAAEQLNKRYQPPFKQFTASKISPTWQEKIQPLLTKISELLMVKQTSEADRLWFNLLANSDFSQRLQLAEWATQKEWYYYAVQATIKAKAWSYVPLRLPLAYPLWFKVNLQDKVVTSSFAMAIARQESAWHTTAKSYANAYGLMQLLPSTAKQTAKQAELPYHDSIQLYQSFDNIMLGTAHLQQLADRFGYNRILIAAAYNAGSHRVDSWLERSAGKLDMDEFIATIPFYETRNYVQNVLTYDYYYQLLQQLTPQKFSKIESDRLY